MLLLSRKIHEKITLPTVGATIQVVQIKGGTVRLGIDAPPRVTILRAELAERAAEWDTSKASPPPPPDDGVGQRQFRSQVAERLKTAAMGLGLLRLQLDGGALDEVYATLTRLQDDLRLLRFGVQGEDEPTPAAPPRQAIRPRRALLVEDDRNQCELLAGFLRQSGLDVDTAGDGADALNYLGSHRRPDVVLLDMGLPRVDGPTAVREIRRNPAYAGLKIFAVTGRSPEEFDLERGPGGIDAWFQKPLDPAALLQGLTERLDGRPCDV
jgi:carbon storage regulator CsrA